MDVVFLLVLFKKWRGVGMWGVVNILRKIWCMINFLLLVRKYIGLLEVNGIILVGVWYCLIEFGMGYIFGMNVFLYSFRILFVEEFGLC